MPVVMCTFRLCFFFSFVFAVRHRWGRSLADSFGADRFGLKRPRP